MNDEVKLTAEEFAKVQEELERLAMEGRDVPPTGPATEPSPQ